jgi:1-acyl-sn-glycerol-3-phosphate acyltransferase
LGRRFWAVVLTILIWLLLRVEVRGAEHLPATAAGIVYYNHIHWLDPVLICGTIRRYAVPLTKIEASRWPFVGWLLRWYHVIFIRRGTVDRAALKATWDVLTDGDISVISPEGTRSLDGRLQAAKEGLAFIARQTPDTWLMPCAVVGTPAFSWSLNKVYRRPRVLLTYGRPFRFCWPGDTTDHEGKPEVSREILREMTDEAMAQLAAILPPEMRGDYADSDPAQHKWLEFLGIDAE